MDVRAKTPFTFFWRRFVHFYVCFAGFFSISHQFNVSLIYDGGPFYIVWGKVEARLSGSVSSCPELFLPIEIFAYCCFLPRLFGVQVVSFMSIRMLFLRYQDWNLVDCKFNLLSSFIRQQCNAFKNKLAKIRILMM